MTSKSKPSPSKSQDSTKQAPISPEESKLIEKEVDELLLQHPVDLQKLRAIARRPGGFQNNQLRKRVWPKILGINRYHIPDYHYYVERHKDDAQVRCDVERSLWNYEPMKFWKITYREKRRKVLADIIVAILSRNKQLHYYQGFHDLVSVIMLVMEDDYLSFALAEQISLKYLSDYMREDFEIVSQFMHILLVLIRASDLELYEHLQKARMEPFFAISWLITWFSHDIRELDQIARIFDVLLCSPPIFCFYVCTAYVIHLKGFIMNVEPDFALIHDALIRSPHKYGFSFELLVNRADDLYKKLPLSNLLLLCDRPLYKLITCNKILLFEKPSFLTGSVDADWKLLEKLKLKKWKNLHLLNYYLRSSWGVTITIDADDLKARKKRRLQRLHADSNSKLGYLSYLGGYLRYWGDFRELFTLKYFFWSITILLGGFLGIYLYTKNGRGTLPTNLTNFLSSLPPPFSLRWLLNPSNI